MSSCTKITVDIPTALLDRARRIAAAEKIPVRALIEEGLRIVIERRRLSALFTLRDASFRGRGAQPGLDEGDWTRLSELARR